MQKYGGNKGDRSKSHRDYAHNKARDKHPGQDKREREEYDARHNKAYGGDMGDDSASHRDYSHKSGKAYSSKFHGDIFKDHHPDKTHH